MIIFYISIRPITFDGKRLLTPKYMLEDGFRGIPIEWQCISNGIEDDSRWVYEIITDTIEHQDVILEGLQMWGVHLKTIESAEILVCKLSKREDISVLNDKIILPKSAHNPEDR